jgi:hypothetical protein
MTLSVQVLLEIIRKSACFELFVPFTDPGGRADVAIDFLEVIARLVVFALLFHAAMVVYKVHPAALGLIHVGETRIKPGREELITIKTSIDGFHGLLPLFMGWGHLQSTAILTQLLAIKEFFRALPLVCRFENAIILRGFREFDEMGRE